MFYSRKPNPSLKSTNSFDEDIVRDNIRNTLTVAKDCNVEMIMKDLHTTQNNPQRVTQWVEMVRREM